MSGGLFLFSTLLRAGGVSNHPDGDKVQTLKTLTLTARIVEDRGAVYTLFEVATDTHGGSAEAAANLQDGAEKIQRYIRQALPDKEDTEVKLKR